MSDLGNLVLRQSTTKWRHRLRVFERCRSQEFCTKIAVEQFQRVAQRHRVLVGCAAASMRYHDEIRVFSRLMAKSVVGNNQ